MSRELSPEGVADMLRELIARATPGPWHAIGPAAIGVIAACDCGPAGIDTPEGVFVTSTSQHESHEVVPVLYEADIEPDRATPDANQFYRDCQLIALSHNWLPQLLDWLAAARREVAVLNGILADMREDSTAYRMGMVRGRAEALAEARHLLGTNYFHFRDLLGLDKEPADE